MTEKGILRALTLLAAISFLTVACGDHETAGPEVRLAPVKAPVAIAERVEVPQQVELYGTVEAERTAAVSTRVMAMITAVRVRPGDEVGKGQLLLNIDPQAAEGQLAQARGALGQARAALALTERNYERFRALAAADAASELEVDMARMQYEQALGAVEQATGAVSAASAVASDSRITAPFAGRVVRKMVEVGDLAAPGRPLLMLESAGERRLVLAVPESLMREARLEVGDEVPTRIDARPELETLIGTVVETTPGADPASHSFLVKVVLPVDDLPSGSAGRARIVTATRSAVTVPAPAVMRQGGMSLVVVRNAEGRTSSRVVTLGETFDDGRVEVLSGLAGGETVLLGLTSVPPSGAPVEAE